MVFIVDKFFDAVFMGSRTAKFNGVYLWPQDLAGRQQVFIRTPVIALTSLIRAVLSALLPGAVRTDMHCQRQ